MDVTSLGYICPAQEHPAYPCMSLTLTLVTCNCICVCECVCTSTVPQFSAVQGQETTPGEQKIFAFINTSKSTIASLQYFSNSILANNEKQ